MLNTYLKTILVVITFFCSQNLFAQYQLEYLYENDLTFAEKVEQAEAFFDEQGRGKGTGYKQFLRWKYSAQQALDDKGYVLSEEHNIAEFEKFVAKNPTDKNKSMSTWVEKGPISATNTSTWSSHIGRLSNIAIDPNDDQHLVVTSLGGGVWKTLNEGTVWTPLFDQESTMSLQSAMISHADPDHYFIGGNGIWRSLDGGASFSKLTGPAGTIYTIIQDPVDADIILASSGNGRVYKTIDGGDSWTSALLQSSRQFYDLDFKPGNTNVLYACGRQGAFYTSTNQGDTWTALAGPWNTSRTIMFAVTPADPEYLYVVQEGGGGFDALYLSTNGGATWTTQSDDSANNNNIMGYNLTQKGGQAPRDMDIIVSPTDKTEVHVAGVMTFKSNDSGVNWTQTTHWVVSNPLPFVHADIDQLIYHGSKIYVASDGGIFISEDAGASFIDKTTGLGIRQFYRISSSPTEVERVAGGSQDNGTGVLRGGIWYDFMGADGMEPLIMNNDDDIIIGSIQFGQLNKSINGGNSLTSMSQTQGGQSGEWVTPLERDPIAANTMYQGKKQLYKTVNAGSSWTTISAFDGSSNMDEICIAPTDNKVIYVSFGSVLHKTVDGGENWNTVNMGAVGAYINYINIDPNDKEHVILAVSSNDRFIESTDGGATWSIIKYNLPNITARSVVFDGTDNNGIYVSLSKGVYYKDDLSPTSWTLMDNGLPKVDARELEVVNDKLYLATYGRGLWEMPITGRGYTFNVNYELIDCISNGTQDSLDDSFTFQIDPKGMGLGTSYSISGDYTQANIAYGTPFLLDNNGSGFLKQDGAVQLTVTDDSNNDIVVSFSVEPILDENCFSNLVCEDAFPLTYTGTYNASGPSSGGGGSTAGRNANWFYFVAPADGKISVNSCGRGQDTNLKIHNGVCENKTVIASSDDNCTMGPGLNNYASQVNDISVISGQLYYIEWDSRWSGNPFVFEFEFVEECIDYIIYNVNGVQEEVISASTQIRLNGTLNGNLEARTDGEVLADDMLVEVNGSIDVINETCVLNEFFDVKMIHSTSTAIPDEGMVEIPFTFPTVITESVTNFRIGLDIEHPDLSQLTISLVSPSGSVIPFWEGFCAMEADLDFILDLGAVEKDLCGANWRLGLPTIADGMFDQTEVNNVLTRPISGNWKLRFEDNTGGDTGTVKEAFIYFKG